MTSKQQKGLSSDRVHDAVGVNVTHLECPVCRDTLWKPIACQSCETPFCSSCINKWLVNNPNKCPNQCAIYTERKCPPFIVKLLAQLQISCFYRSNGCQQIVSYEGLDKHELECIYQSKQCPGCQLEILKQDFENHTKDCLSIESTCEDCQLVYKRCDAIRQHTENICLKEQLRQVRNELQETKCEIHELTHQFKQLWAMNPSLTKIRILFDDLPNVSENTRWIPDGYKGLKWNKISYMHGFFALQKYPTSGYATSFLTTGNAYIAYFVQEMSISVEYPNKKFNFLSISACAAWNNDLQLTIIGHQNSKEIKRYVTTLLFGKPQLIVLNWEDIDEVICIPSGGTAHPDSGGTGEAHVVITQIAIGALG